MVVMTRHSKNSTANSVYTYHEKHRDANESGYGSLKLRLGKDAVNNFDCCSLSLHPCRDPVITPDGYLYDKESILEYVITKRNEISKKVKEYEKQCKKEERELQEIGAAEERSRVEKFLKTEEAVASASQAAQAGTSQVVVGISISNVKSGNEKKLPSFWIPSLTPGNKEWKLQKPDKTVYCPMSGKPLKVKDLIEVKFTRVNDRDQSSLVSQNERYKCPVTGDILGNQVPCAVLRPTGHVVTMECVEKIIRKDMLHPITGKLLLEKDIIQFQRGGTGFSSTNQQLVSVKARPALQS